ncbi:MAG: Maf family protein, partial [Novosphingobium sp.]
MIVLASQSASRRAMLTAAGVEHEAIPAHVDERAIEAGLAGQPAAAVAQALAEAKAMAIGTQHPGRLVLGSDSLVEVAGRRFDKPQSRENAAEHLRFFSGKTMHLHSAAAL